MPIRELLSGACISHVQIQKTDRHAILTYHLVYTRGDGVAYSHKSNICFNKALLYCFISCAIFL